MLQAKTINSFLMKSISDEDGFVQILIPKGPYALESINDGIKRIIIEEEHYTGANYPFKIKPNFSTLGSIIETSPQGLKKSFKFDDSIRDLLRFGAVTIFEKKIIT